MNLLALADFELVASHGGYAEAARRAGRPKTTLSRRVLELEEELGVRLLERGRRSVRLTEAGSMLHERISPLLAGIADAAASASAAPARPEGRLRISAPLLLSEMMLGRIVAGFCCAFPEVLVDVTAEDRLVDPAMDGYDVVIRVNPSPDEQLVGRCVLRDERWLVASPALPRPPANTGTGVQVLPVVVRDVPPLDTVWSIRDGTDSWRFKPKPKMRLGMLSMLRGAVLEGAAAGLLPRSLVLADVAAGRLVSWGVEEASQTEIWALHTSARLVSAKVRAFMTYLIDEFARTASA